MYPTAMHKTITQKIDSLQVERSILQKQPKMIKKMIKNWDRNTISNLGSVCPKTEPRFPLSIVVVKDTFVQIKD